MYKYFMLLIVVLFACDKSTDKASKILNDSLACLSKRIDSLNLVNKNLKELNDSLKMAPERTTITNRTVSNASPNVLQPTYSRFSVPVTIREQGPRAPGGGTFPRYRNIRISVMAKDKYDAMEIAKKQYGNAVYSGDVKIGLPSRDF